jgi:hypothetical protein
VLSRDHAADALEQEIGGGGLQDHPRRPELQGLDDLRLLDTRGQQDDPDGRGGGRELGQGVHPRHAGHGEVEKEDVGLQLLGEPDRLLAAAGLPDHGEAALRFEERAQALAEDRMVVRDEHTNRLRASHMPPFVQSSPHVRQGSFPVAPTAGSRRGKTK